MFTLPYMAVPCREGVRGVPGPERQLYHLPLSKKRGSCPRVFFNFRLLQEADVQYDGKPELREMYYWLCVTAEEGKMR